MPAHPSGVPAGGGRPRLDPKALGATVSSLYRGVFGAASGAGIAIGAYFAFYGAACNALSRHTDLAPSAVAFVAGGIAAVGSSVVIRLVCLGCHTPPCRLPGLFGVVAGAP
jgi:hypothetical protein